MGNLSPRPTKKLEMLVNEVQDFSFNMSYNISQSAEQNVVVIQSQTVNISANTFKNCNVDILQNAEIFITQIATFKNVFQDPRELMYYIVTGPNSIFNQAMRSSSEVMQEFTKDLKKTLEIEGTDKYDTDRNLKLKLTKIFKANLSQTTIQRATQNVFVSQNQTVDLITQLCKKTDFTIAQNLILNIAQNAMFTIVQDTLVQDPNIRRAIRQFNGDYDKGLLDEYMDAGANIPDACYNLMPIKEVTRPCPPCEPCELSPQEIIDKYYPNSIIFQSWLVYGSIMFILLILFYSLYLKIQSIRSN